MSATLVLEQPDVAAEALGLMTIPAPRGLGVEPDSEETVLSSQEEDDLHRLEAVFERGQRESIAALREIRERKLHRIGYTTFDEYVERRWGRSRQWATQQINWLRRVELLEAIGKNSYQLNVDDAQALGPLEEHPEEFVRAITEAEEEARRNGKKRTTKMLQAAVARQRDYLARRAETEDLTYDESLALASVGSKRTVQPNLVAEAEQHARESEHPLADCLVEVCRARRALPSDEHLLRAARGEALVAICQRLAELRADWEQESDLEKEERELSTKLADIRQRKAKQVTAPLKLAAGSDDEIEAESDEEAEEHDEDHDEEPEEIEAQYRIRATGDFAELLGAVEDGAEVMLSMDEFIDEMYTLLHALEDGSPVMAESSITVSPVEPQQEE